MFKFALVNLKVASSTIYVCHCTGLAVPTLFQDSPLLSESEHSPHNAMYM